MDVEILKISQWKHKTFYIWVFIMLHSCQTIKIHYGLVLLYFIGRNIEKFNSMKWTDQTIVILCPTTVIWCSDPLLKDKTTQGILLNGQLQILPFVVECLHIKKK